MSWPTEKCRNCGMNFVPNLSSSSLHCSEECRHRAATEPTKVAHTRRPH